VVAGLLDGRGAGLEGEVGGEVGLLEAIDDFTVRWTFASPYPLFLDILAGHNAVGVGPDTEGAWNGGGYMPKHYMSQFLPAYSSEEEVTGLRDYLKAGGFLVIDDFWGTREWAVFEWNMDRVFPEHPIIDLDLEHPVFNTFYEIDEILQVPAYGRYWGGRTSERDGYVPYVKGIEDHDGRLMAIINWNTDLGDAWEWAEQPDYPLKYSTFAFQMGVNMIVYAMSH